MPTDPSASSSQINPPIAVDLAMARALFDGAYGELYSIEQDRVEVEVIAPLPTDTVRLFFELADEAICDPKRDDPFAQEKKVFELSSEALAQELARLQALGESALVSLGRGGGISQSRGQLPTMLATMQVGAVRVKPAPAIARLKAAALDGTAIVALSALMATFIMWFTAQTMRSGLLSFDIKTWIAFGGLFGSLLLPMAIAYYLKPSRSYGLKANYLEIVNAKSGNLVSHKTLRIRAWLAPLGIPSLLLLSSGRWLADRATGSTMRRNYALRAKTR